jgi:hypothetical protein
MWFALGQNCGILRAAHPETVHVRFILWGCQPSDFVDRIGKTLKYHLSKERVLAGWYVLIQCRDRVSL